MTETHFLRDLIILYGMAMVIAYLMRQARQPTLVGYLITGVVAGPYGLSLIADSAGVELLAEIGVALLLFTIGLELSLGTLARMKRTVLGAGSVQIGATLFLTSGALFATGMAARETLFWGFLVGASSTAIVMKLMQERGELDSTHGRIILGILLFQDLCVVPMMALLPALAAPGAAQTVKILLAVLKSLAVVSAILLGARYLFPPLLRAIVVVRSRELFVIAAIFFALGTAWGASQLGLSLALGSFLAGIVLSESEYGHQIMAEILPFRDSLNSLFFITVGMLIDLRFLAAHAPIVVGITAAVVAGKLCTGGLAVVALRFPLRMAALVGMALAQVGEFSFVLLREGNKLALITPDGYQIFLAASVLTMMLTPALVSAAPRVSLWLSSRLAPAGGVEAPPAELRDHTIICGYGVNGRRLARLLRDNGLPYVVVEMDGNRVRAGLEDGEFIQFGDVSNREILARAGAGSARAIIFAISDATVLARAISHARLLSPDLHIVARTKRLEDAHELSQAGASNVIVEEVEAWMEIVVRVMRLYGLPRQVVAAQIEALRGEDYEMLRVMHIPGQPLLQLAHLLPQVDADLFIVAPGSSLVGAELRRLDLRTRSGAWVLAIVREAEVLHNPAPDFRLEAADQIVLIGSREQLTSAFSLLQK